MNPLMALIMMLLHHTMQQRQQQQGARDPLGAAMPGQRPQGPTGNGPGGATLPSAAPLASKGVPSLQGPQGVLQGRQGAQGPFSGLASLINAAGLYPHQQTSWADQRGAYADQPKAVNGGPSAYRF